MVHMFHVFRLCTQKNHSQLSIKMLSRTLMHNATLVTIKRYKISLRVQVSA